MGATKVNEIPEVVDDYYGEDYDKEADGVNEYNEDEERGKSAKGRANYKTSKTKKLTKGIKTLDDSAEVPVLKKKAPKKPTLIKPDTAKTKSGDAVSKKQSAQPK